MFTSITIAMYFFYSGFLYLAVAFLQLGTRATIKESLCAIPGALNVSAKQDVGCDNCPSVLAMCPKDPCYQYAMNITYTQEAKATSDGLFEVFSIASTDDECFQIVQGSSSPYAAMREIITKVDSVTTSCVSFHCAVLRNAIGPPAGTLEGGAADLMSESGFDCTNVFGVKPVWFDNWCACSEMSATLKADLEAGLTGATSIETACSVDLLGSAGWLQAQTGTTTTAPSTAASDSTSAGATTADPTTTAATTAASGGGATARRMRFDADAEEQVYAVDYAGSDPYGCDLSSSAPCAHLQATYGSEEDRSSDAAEWMEAANDAAPTAEFIEERPSNEPRSSAEVQAKRRLTAAVAVNADYTVGDWTPCKCYQQCIPGLRTRQVNCFGGNDPTIDVCNGDRPHSAEACECEHCADCAALLNLLIVMISYFVQGGVAMLCFLIFLYYDGKPWSIAIRWNIFEKFAGFFIKNLPPIVRLMVLVNLFQLLFLAFQALVPTDIIDFNSDCNTVLWLEVIAGVSLAVCGVQILFGLAARRVTRRPPWLFAPESSTLPAVLRPISKLMAALGP